MSDKLLKPEALVWRKQDPAIKSETSGVGAFLWALAFAAFVGLVAYGGGWNAGHDDGVGARAAYDEERYNEELKRRSQQVYSTWSEDLERAHDRARMWREAYVECSEKLGGDQ